jgi:hypothetical protein
MASDEQVPEEFRSAVRMAVAQVGWQLQQEDESGLECVNSAGVRQSIGLPGLYRRFRDQPAAEWPTLVANHFRVVASLTAPGPASDDLNAQSASLLVRVGPPYPSVPPVSVWSRPIPGTELATMLVLQQGPGMRFVRVDMIEESGRSGDDWCTVGLDNLRRQTPAGSLRVVEPESGLLACCVGDAHDASRSLFVDELLPEPAPHGVLLSVPRRDALLALPVNRKATLQRSLALLKLFTQSQHDEASHPISPEVFWVRQGVWQPVGITVSEAGVQMSLPAELIEIFRGLVGTEPS